MEEISTLINQYINKTLYDEDNNLMTIEFSPQAAKEDIELFEKRNDIIIPSELKYLLKCSNGCQLFTETIFSLDEIEFYADENLLIFHSWGNGDFDAISTKDNSIYFVRHSVENIFFVCNSLSVWLYEVIKEIELNGTLLHPLDYNSQSVDGLYKTISRII